MNYDDTRRLKSVTTHSPTKPQRNGGLRVVLRRRGTKGYHADGLKNTESTRDEFHGCPTVFLWRMRTLSHNCKNDDDHTYKRECRGPCKFCNVAVEGERVRHEGCTKDNDDLSVYEDGEDGRCSY